MNDFSTDMIVVVGERSAGNAQVGDMWLETGIFDVNNTILDVLNWADDRNISGKIIITKSAEDRRSI